MAVTIDGNNTPTAGGVVYGDGTEYASTTAGTTGQALISAGAGVPAFGTLGIAGGGTNSTDTPTAGTVPYGTGTALAYTVAGTSGQLLQSNGASAPSWVAASGGFSSAQIFTASGTFTVPTSGKFKITIVGGGGSGTRSTGTTNGACGGGAGTAMKWFSGATAGDSATVTIGAGGPAITTDNTSGTTGGASTFVLSGFSTVTANGGIGAAALVGGLGGTASNGDVNISGQRGGNPITDAAGSFAVGWASKGGDSILGLGAEMFGGIATVISSTGYGAGGMGSRASFDSGAGTGGICIVEF